MSHDLRTIRREFPDLDGATYLNTASNGLVPERARLVLERFFNEQQYVEGLSPYDLFEVLATTRVEVARLLDCSQEAIALTFNTSHGLNLAANSIPMVKGDNVVLANGEFPGNVYPWRNLESRGIELRWVEPPGGRADAESLIAACDAHTRIVTVSAVQFHDGCRPDLAALAAHCREHDIRTVVDGAQAIGSCVVHPAELGIDFIAGCGQKWLCAPRGTGFLYVRAELVRDLRLPMLGWLNVDYGGRFDRLLEYPRQIFPDARRFELGTANLHDILMLRESLRLLNEIGIDRVAAHDAGLAQRLRTALHGASGLELCDVGSSPSPIIAFAVRAERAKSLHHALRDARIHYSLREGRFRFAPHIYNDEADIDRTADVITTSLQA